MTALMIAALMAAVLFVLPAMASGKKGWNVSFGASVPKKVVEAEKKLFGAIPAKMCSKLGEYSTGMTVYTLKGLPKKAKNAKTYSLSPIVSGGKICSYENEAYVMLENYDGVIVHRLDGLNDSSKTQWGSALLSEFSMLLEKYQSSDPKYDGDLSHFFESLKNFAMDNAGWILFRCPNLVSLIKDLL